MKKVDIKVVALRDGVIPSYATEQSAGLDVKASIDSPISIAPGERVLVPTGLKVAIPEGYEIQVRPRSGLALKKGITVLNSPGTIDADYRGEIGVVLINHGYDVVVIEPMDRIAQLVVAEVTKGVFSVVDSLDTTERNDGGFGHTGNK